MEAVNTFEQDHKKFPGWKIFSEGDLNMEGYHLLSRNDYVNAIKIFQLITEAYPESANSFDSLGEAYLKSGNKKEAAANYWKSLKMDPANENAKKMLATLGEKI